MTTPREQRITTTDPDRDKRERVTKAIGLKKYSKWSNRKLAALLGVDESMIRRYRAASEPKPKKKPVKARRRGPGPAAAG